MEEYIYVLHMWLFPPNTNCVILNICSELGFFFLLTTHFRDFFFKLSIHGDQCFQLLYDITLKECNIDYLIILPIMNR